jgi:hypothetical protein
MKTTQLIIITLVFLIISGILAQVGLPMIALAFLISSGILLLAAITVYLNGL